MEAEKMNEVEIDIRELFFVLWQRKLVIVLAGILVAAAAFAWTHFMITPMYESTTSFYITNKQDENQNQVTNADLTTSTTLTADVQALITSRLILSQVIQELGLEMTESGLKSRITVNNQDKTRMLTVTVKDEDPVRAKKITDVLAEVSSETLVEILRMERMYIVDEGNLPTAPDRKSVV